MGFPHTTEMFIQKANLIHGTKYDYSFVEYKNAITKVVIKCNIHNITFNQKPNDHLSGKGCPNCCNTTKLSTTEFISKAKNIHNELFSYELVEYVNNRINIKIICKDHGIFEQLPTNHLKGYGCPKCRASKGEVKIRTVLDSYIINYEEQKNFDDCRDKRTLPFDFYLPDHNLCIEFDGELHFNLPRWSKNKLKMQTKLLITQTHDQIKTQFCKDNRLILLRIPYWDIKNIDKIINDCGIFN
jgi:hypothetical protein